MKFGLGGKTALPAFSGGSKVTALERKLERMEARIADLEQRLARSETRFEMSVRFFEHRVDQIYARILPVLGRETGLFAGPDEPVAAPPLAAPAAPVALAADALDWAADDSGGFIRPGRYVAPLADAGFRLALGLVVERDGVMELQAGQRGAAVFGPYKRLSPGSYRFRWILEPAGADDEAVDLGFDLYSPSTDRVLAQTRLAGPVDGERLVELPVTVGAELSGSVFELRLHQHGGGAVGLVAIEVERT